MSDNPPKTTPVIITGGATPKFIQTPPSPFPEYPNVIPRTVEKTADGLQPLGYWPNNKSGKSIGVFSENPGNTPKYNRWGGQKDAEYRDTMARLFVQLPDEPGIRKRFINSVPPETRALAGVLVNTGFIDFLLTSAQETMQEKIQIVDMASDTFVVYAFGQAAPVFQYAGMLLNTYQDDQRLWFLRLYRDVLRATQLARRRMLARLRYDSVIVSGVMTNLTEAMTGDIENAVSFSFSFIPMQYVIFSPTVGAPTELNTPFTPSTRYAQQGSTPPNLRPTVTLATGATKLPGEEKKPAAKEKKSETEVVKGTAQNKLTENSAPLITKKSEVLVHYDIPSNVEDA